jgi:hypothetical protein
MAIIATETVQYIPQFNIDTGNYEDISPFVRNQRGGQTYTCSCRHSNKSFIITVDGNYIQIMIFIKHILQITLKL